MCFAVGLLFSACLSLSFCENLTSTTNLEGVLTTESTSSTTVAAYFEEDEINNVTINATDTTVSISWKKNGPDVEYKLILTPLEALYEVDGKCAITDEQKEFTTSDTEYTFEDLKPFYRYNITIQYGTNEQNFNAETKESTPGNIRNLVLSEENFTLTVSWTLPCNVNGQLKQFNIELNGNYTGNKINEHKNSTSVQYEDGQFDYEVKFSVRPSMAYQLQINAENEGNLFSESELKTFSTQEIVPGKPLDLHIDKDNTSFFLTWTEPEEPNGKILNYQIDLTDNGPLYERRNDCEEINKSNSYTTTELSFEINDLSPYFSYSITLRAENAAGLGEPSELTENTDEAVPEKIPSFEIQVSELFDSEEFEVNITFSWELPCDINGQLSHFLITIKETNKYIEVEYEKGYETLKITKSSNDFDLKPFTSYAAEIQAYLNNGNSSEPLTKTFSTPEFIPDAITELTITKITATNVEFHWTAPELNGELLNYETTLNIYGPSYETNEPNCKINQEPRIFNTTENHSNFGELLPFYNYSIGVKACTKLGCGADYTEIFQTLSSTPKPPTNLTSSIITEIITPDTYNVTIMIEWVDPCLQNGQIDKYEIVTNFRYTENSSYSHENRDCVNFNETNAFYIDVKPSSNYTVVIYAILNEFNYGESAEISFTTPTAYPSTVTDIQNQTNSSAFTITWSEPDNLNGKIEEYLLEFTDSGPIFDTFNNDDCPSHEKNTTNLTTTETSYTFDNLLPFSEYVVKISAKTSAGYGQALEIPIETLPTIPDPVRYLSPTLDISTQTATITWTVPCRINGQLTHFNLNLMDGQIHIENRTVQYENNSYNYTSVFKKLENNENYILTVVAVLEDNSESDGETVTFKFPIKAADSQKLLIILLSTLIPIILIAFVVLLFTIRKKKSLQKMKNGTPPNSKHSTPKTSKTIPDRDISINKYFSYYKKITTDPKLLKDQYISIENECKLFEVTCNYALLPENRRKNRYINILPFDSTRVRLKMDEDDEISSDYINASYIKGYSGHTEYIATQGPLKVTCKDFWNMILEENVTVIAMVAQFMEQGKEKCYKYIPSNFEEISLGHDFKVACLTELSFSFYSIRTLLVEKGDTKHNVTHFQYLDWPDFGVPSNTESLLLFAVKVRERVEHDGGLMAVHCSAGVGRTGTLISIDILLQMLKKESRISIYKVVLDLRRQRSKMVQTETQYMFIHTCINDYLQNPSIEDKEVYEELNEPIYENVNDCKERLSAML